MLGVVRVSRLAMAGPLGPRNLIAHVTGARCYRAAVCTKLGAPLSIEEQGKAVSALKDSEVCIDVQYAAVNYADMLMCAGQYQVV